MKWISQKAVCKTVFFYAKIYIVVICGLRVLSKKRVRCPGPESNKRAMRRKEEIMLYIGIDLGTSAVKLLLLSSEGKIVNMVSREYPLSFPHPGWSEQNPADWFEQSMEGVKELLKGQDASQVAGISFGGQMHGLVILDENDNIIRPAILWNDGRTGAETDYLNNEIGKAKLTELTGNIAFPGFTAPKILWVKKNEPDNFAKIAKIMLPKDYLAYRSSCHRRFRCIRNASLRRKEPHLVKGNVRYLRREGIPACEGI